MRHHHGRRSVHGTGDRAEPCSGDCNRYLGCEYLEIGFGECRDSVGDLSVRERHSVFGAGRTWSAAAIFGYSERRHKYGGDMDCFRRRMQRLRLRNDLWIRALHWAFVLAVPGDCHCDSYICCLSRSIGFRNRNSRFCSDVDDYSGEPPG